ncbi:MAG: Txe/YoeB family addiction module toxin [Bacteroidales bacterium]|jgi:toxin YoeB|nr:Txe/YoeB family addiction module toxin [Bacteroidales bacterium]
MYEIEYSPEAERELNKIIKSDKQSRKKLRKLIEELHEHPRTGTGKPELLKGTSYYSRRITQKHRLVYEILDSIVLVYVLVVSGHYEDK